MPGGGVSKRSSWMVESPAARVAIRPVITIMVVWKITTAKQRHSTKPGQRHGAGDSCRVAQHLFCKIWLNIGLFDPVWKSKSKNAMCREATGFKEYIENFLSRRLLWQNCCIEIIFASFHCTRAKSVKDQLSTAGNQCQKVGRSCAVSRHWLSDQPWSGKRGEANLMRMKDPK